MGSTDLDGLIEESSSSVGQRRLRVVLRLLPHLRGSLERAAFLKALGSDSVETSGTIGKGSLSSSSVGGAVEGLSSGSEGFDDRGGKGFENSTFEIFLEDVGLLPLSVRFRDPTLDEGSGFGVGAGRGRGERRKNQRRKEEQRKREKRRENSQSSSVVVFSFEEVLSLLLPLLWC